MTTDAQTTDIEKVVLSNLVYNDEFTKKTIAFFKEEYFQQESTKFLFNQINEFVNKYGARPTKEALEVILQESTLPEGIYNEAYAFVLNLENTGEDTQWLIDTSEQWARDRAIENGLHEAIAIVTGDNKKVDKSAIPGILEEALGVSFDTYLGHNYFESAEEHWELMHSDVKKFPFAIDILNRVTRGGIPPKTLNVIMMAINLGKTTWLIDQTAHWMLNGKNVLVFTMEVSEDVYRERLDTRVNELTFDEVLSLDKTQYLNRVQSIRERTTGDCYIKEYPDGSVHVGHLRHHLNELRLKKKFVPDLIVVDQLTNMRSSRIATLTNSDTYYTSVAGELRGLGQEFGVPVWTAAQFNREGQEGSKKPSFNNIGLALGIAKIADFILGGTQPPEMEPLNQGIFHVLKNRYNNKTKIRTFTLGIDNERQMIKGVDDVQQLHVNGDAEVRKELGGGAISARLMGMSNEDKTDPDTGEVFGGWKL